MMQNRFEILKRLPLLLGVMLIAVGGGAVRQAAAQTTITLNLSARMGAADAPVTLASIARLDGPEASRFGEVVVLERADAKPAVSLADIRAKLQAAGANFGKLTLRGSSCRIELPGATPAAAKAVTERARTGPDYQVIDMDGPPTIRTAIARRLAAMHSVAHDAIQIAFDEKDHATLATPHSERQTVHVQPAASASSSRVPLRISVYVADRVIAEYRLTADILLRREVLVATREIDRRELISDPDVRLESRWIPPGENPPGREAIVGLEARSRIKEGSTLIANAVESPVVIRRGDVVYVECLSGSMVVRARAKALGAGREGETIPFQMDGADDSFMARIAGRGRAVMLAAPGFDEQARTDGPQVRR